MVKELVRCSNCDEVLQRSEDIELRMCKHCLDFLSLIALSNLDSAFIPCHVCGTMTYLPDFGSILSVEDCICNDCNHGIDKYGR